MTNPTSFDVVVPTIGRPSLTTLLEALVHGAGPAPGRVVVVDDRPFDPQLDLPVPECSRFPIIVRRTYGAGPAAARNVGWVDSPADWIVFVDDDVVLPPDWLAAVAEDLRCAPRSVAAVQGQVRVPLPLDRAPTDWERNVAGLSTARWITADIAYRRRALEAVGGFDERFRHAYREDSDLALQVLDRVGPILRGRRWVHHPVASARWDVSVRRQAGNADDALMRRRYGRQWRQRAGATNTRLRAHAVTTAFAAAAVVGAATGRRRVCAVAASAWAVSTVEFIVARVRSGPRTPNELVTLAITSAAIPPVALWHRARGELRLLRDTLAGLRPHVRIGPRSTPSVVLFDRDGTLVHDVPYNGDPDVVAPVDGVAHALARVRAAGVGVGVVTNQSGIARGLLTAAEARAVNRRLDELVGPIDHWLLCPHGPDDHCRCRKPASGMVRQAAVRFRVTPLQCAVVGDTEADVAAGRSVGARAILVPNAATQAVEVTRAPETAATVADAVDRLLGVGP